MDELILSQAYVNGAWVSAASGETFEVCDPHSGEVIANVPKMSAEDTRGAIAVAQAAQAAWSAKLPAERARLLRRWRDLIIERRDDFSMDSNRGRLVYDGLK